MLSRHLAQRLVAMQAVSADKRRQFILAAIAAAAAKTRDTLAETQRQEGELQKISF